VTKILRFFDSILVVLASRLLVASYRRFGYAPVATQFSLVLACNVVSGVAGCYLISRWTLPDALTGLLMIVGMANVLWVTSSSAPYKRIWTQNMYERVAMQARARYRDRMFERLVSSLSAVLCCIGALITLAGGQMTGSAVFAGLGALSLSGAISGYLRAAPPPVPDQVALHLLKD